MGKSLPGTSHKVMPRSPVHCLTVHILILSLQPAGLVTPIHLSGVNVHERLKVLEVTEMSSPNKTPHRCQQVVARVQLGCPKSRFAGEL